MPPPLTNNGPVFEPAPGWGGRLRTWISHNKFFALLMSALVVFLVIFLIIKGTPDPKNLTTLTFISSPVPTALVTTNAVETVRAGDSYTTVARRAVTTAGMASSDSKDYLPGPRLYAETKLARDLQTQPLIIGAKITYHVSTILEYLNEYEGLYPKQKAQWEYWASRVKF